MAIDWIVAGVLLFNVGLAICTFTEQILEDGEVWFVPSPTLMVMLADPLPLAVTVTVVPLTLTVATPVLLDLAEIDPLPDLVTDMVPVKLDALSDRLVLFKLKLPEALAMLQVTDLAPVEPSLHL